MYLSAMGFRFMYALFFLLLIGSSGVLSAYGQNGDPYSEELNVENGRLPVNNMYEVYFDSQGRGWFASVGNLLMNIGNGFESVSLGNFNVENGVYEMAEDPSGDMWFVNSQNGIYTYRGDSIAKFPFNDSLSSYVPVREYISSFGVTDDYLYLGYRAKGLFRVSRRDGRVKCFGCELQTSLDTTKVYLFLKQTHNQLVVGQYRPPLRVPYSRPEHIVVRVGENDETERVDEFFVEQNFGPQQGYPAAIALDHGHYLVSKGASIALSNPRGTAVAQAYDSEVRNMALDNEHRLWVRLASDKIYRYPGSDPTATPQEMMKGRSLSFEHPFSDHEGGHWFTSPDGLTYIPNLEIGNYRAGGLETAPTKSVAAAPNGDVYYIGAMDNLMKLPSHRKYQRELIVESETESRYPFFLLNYDSLFARLWATSYRGTLVLDTGGKVLSKLPPATFCAFTDDSTAWLAGYAGVFSVDRNSMQVTQEFFHQHYVLTATAFREHFFAVSDDTIWRFNEYGVKPMVIDAEGNTELRYVSLLTVGQDALCLFDAERGMYRLAGDHFIKEQFGGLSPSEMPGLVSFTLNDTSWWMSSSSFFKVAFDGTAMDVTRYPRTVGIAQLGNVQEQLVRDTLYMGSSRRGLLVVPKDRMIAYAPDRKVWIYDVKIAGKDTTLQEEYVLTHKQATVEFEFGSPCFKTKKPLLYRVKLEGLEEDWREIEHNNVQYTTLRAGSYLFRVKAQNQDGHWSAIEYQVRLVVLPAFWETLWFRGLVLVVLVLLIMVLFRWRFSVIRRREQEKSALQRRVAEKELESLKSQLTALQAQMNPHFIFNSLTAIQNFILSNESDEAVSYLIRFSRLMRLILESSQQRFVSLEQEESMLRHYIELQRLRFDQGFDYEVEFGEGITPELVDIPPLLTQPFIENAIEHGLMPKEESGRLSIRFEKENDRLQVMVSDNGIGRVKAAKLRGEGHQSMALKITEQRLQLLNQDHGTSIDFRIFDDQDDRGESIGTRVVFSLPLLLRKSV